MKRFFLLMLTIATISYSCSELLDFLIDHTFDYSHPVNLPAGGPTDYSDEYTFDATDNQEVADNINNVSGYTVNSLKFSIEDFLPDTGIVSGSFSFYFKNSSGSQIGDVTTIPTIDNLFALSASGDKVDIPLTQGTIDAVQNEFSSTNRVTIVVSGTVSDVPVNFIATVYLAIGINVSP